MSDIVEQFEQQLNEREREQFATYYRMLVEWNEKMNLTGITERSEVYGKHFWDSLVIRSFPEWKRYAAHRGSVLDLGTGAGFPGVPLAICFPSVQFTLCDSLQKRLRFLDAVTSELGLKNVSLVHGRAEDLGRDKAYRSRFDVVAARAVARLNALLELTCPFVKPGGAVLAYKGPGIEGELDDGKRAAKVLNAAVERVETFELPEGMGTRSIVVVGQRAPVPPAYPRRPAILQKSPL